MKAEQRKELETNTLADRMGLAMQRVRSSGRRTAFFYVIVGILLFGGFYAAYRWWITSRQEASLNWVRLHDSAFSSLAALEGEKNEAGKAARLQIAWFKYWEEGIKMLGADQVGAVAALTDAGKRYKVLCEECKDDKVFEPQAMLGRAVVEEALAVQDRARLRKATEFYEELKSNYEHSAEGRYAKARLASLQDEAKIKADYVQLQKLLGVPDPRLDQEGQFPGIKKKPE